MSADSAADRRPTPLHDLLARWGASFATGLGGRELAVDFGSPDREHGALRSGCGLFVPTGDLLLLRGEDRHRFLNGLVTCDLKTLAPGHGAYGFFTSSKGRVIADVVATATADGLTLELPPGKSAEIAAHMSKYIVADRVEVESFEGAVRLTLAGPRSHAVLRRLGLEGELPETSWAHAVVRLAGSERGLARAGRVGVPAWTLWVPASEAAVLAGQLLEAGEGEVTPVGHVALQRLRVEARIPLFGQDFDEDFLPQETGVASEAVSFEKGCYLGQEVVARVHFRGQASRAVRALSFTVAEPPATGTELFHEGRVAGKVTSVALSAELGAIGLGTVRRRALAPGTKLDLGGGGEAEVVALSPAPAEPA